MPKFNRTPRSKVPTPDAVNLAGGVAYSKSPELELVQILFVSMLKDSFYRTASAELDRIKELLLRVDPIFAAKAAVYARRVMAMRSVSHFVAGELAERLKGNHDASKFYAAIVERPDDMAEILGYRMGAKKAKKANNVMTHAIRKGFSRAFKKFDGYQLGKYQLKTQALKLVDLVNLIHPNSKSMKELNRAEFLEAVRLQIEYYEKADKLSAKTIEKLKSQYLAEKASESETILVPSLQALMLGLLKSETYQTDLVKAGQAAAAVIAEGGTKEDAEEMKQNMTTEAWKDFLENPAMPYFALLRNLRNIYQNAPDFVIAAAQRLADEKAIKNSLVLPFRFLTAQAEIEKLPSNSNQRILLAAIAQSLVYAFDNIPTLDGETLVALDISSSMQGDVMKHAGLFAAAFCKKNNADLIRYESDAHYFSYNPADSIPTIAKAISAAINATNLGNVFKIANKKYDRVVIFSDQQDWKGGNPAIWLADYEKRFKCRPYVYSWDLKGYGTASIPVERSFAFGGLGADLLELIGKEANPNALVDLVNAVSFDEFLGKRPKKKAAAK